MSITRRNTQPMLPDNLPAGAVAFQAAVDGKLTKEVWTEILEAQIRKARDGDRGAAKFLLDYAGGVTSMRGATFVQENHHHHYAGAGPHEQGTEQISPEDQALGIECGQCGYEPAVANRNQKCPKCNAKRWEQKRKPRMAV